MSDCGCKGYYHSGACSDVNVIFWRDGRIPVRPTRAEIDAQEARNAAHDENARKRFAAGLTKVITGTTGIEIPK